MSGEANHIDAKGDGIMPGARHTNLWPIKIQCYCILAILVVSIPTSFSISAVEVARLVLISIGLVYVQRYWSKRSSLASYTTTPGVRQNETIPQNGLLAVTIIFVVTQFDPGFSSGYGKNVMSWYGVCTTLLVLCAFCMGVFRKKWSWVNALWPIRTLDWVVLITGLGVIGISVGAAAWIGTPHHINLASMVKVVGYILIWFTITRLDGRQSESDDFDPKLWPRITNPVYILFAIAILAGLGRVGGSLYFYSSAGRHFTQNSYDEAIRSYERWAAINQSLDMWMDRGLLNMAHIYGLNGNGDNLSLVLGVLRSRIINPIVEHKTIGDVFYSLSMWDKAIQEYKLLSTTQVDNDLKEKLATAYLHSGHLRWLVSLVRNTGYPAGVVPRTLQNTFDMATVAMITGHYNKAVELYEKLVGSSAAGWKEYYGLGKAYMATDRTEEAIYALESAIKYPDVEADVYYQLAQCYKRLGKGRQAIKHYEKTVLLMPGHMAALNELNKLHKSDNKTSEKLLDLTPDVIINKALSDDLELVGYSFEEEYVTLDEPLRFKMFWRIRADTLSMPERSHFGLCEKTKKECLATSGPYFAADMEKWRMGEVVAIGYEMSVPASKNDTGELHQPLNLVVNVLYRQDHTLRSSLFLENSVEKQEWWWSPKFEIPVTMRSGQ